MTSNKRSRGFCFTKFYDTVDDASAFVTVLESTNYEYYTIGLEVCPDTGRKHLQGYIYFHHPRPFSAVLSDLGTHLHLENAKGTPQQNISYCQKGNDYIENGRQPVQGKRNDLIDYKDAILSGASESDLINDHTECLAKYDRFYKRVRNVVLEQEAKKMTAPEVIVLVGEPGIGKTRYIYDNEPLSDIYKVEVGDGSSGSIWWDGYDGEPVILIDDFHSNFKLDYMLRLLDRYPMKLNIKGGFTWKCARKIYITSNINPSNWYPNCADIHRRALMRRITNIITMTEEALSDHTLHNKITESSLPEQ